MWNGLHLRWMDFAWTNGDSFRRVRWTEALPFYLAIALVIDTEYCVKKKRKKKKKGLMNEQPWQRMEDVINYEAIVVSTHCYIWFKVRRSHRRRRLHVDISKKSYIWKIHISFFFILIYWIIHWLRFIDKYRQEVIKKEED